MDKETEKVIEKFKEVQDILKKFKTREEAIEYLVQETGISKEECSKSYDLFINMNFDR